MRSWEIKSFSVHELKKIACELDRLNRSSNEHYDIGAAAIDSFVRSFGATEQLKVVTVSQGKKILAALPVILGRTGGLFTEATNLANQWYPGRLAALDPHCDATDLVHHLLRGLQDLRVSSLEIDWVSSENATVNTILQLAEAQRLKANVVPKFQCGKIVLKTDWTEFTKNWSKNRRRLIKKAEHNLLQQGSLYTVPAHKLPLAAVEAHFDDCLKIEDGSWKGAQQGSLLKNEFALSFFRESMRRWHASDCLRLYILKSNGRPIAFDFGYAKSGVASSIKISYLLDYAKFSPGHLLNAFVVRDMMADPAIRWIDTLGPLNEANRKWCEESYTCQKIELALPGWLNNSRVQIKDWARTIKRMATADTNNTSPVR